MPRKTKPIALPDKLSALIRLAVSDARKVEKMKTRILDMRTWHEMRGNKCAVCMAGAVMDRSLGADPSQWRGPGDFDGQTSEQLIAIDCVRTGDIHDALSRLGRPGLVSSTVDLVESRIRRNYSDSSRRAPWRVYLKAADMLEAVGL